MKLEDHLNTNKLLVTASELNQDLKTEIENYSVYVYYPSEFDENCIISWRHLNGSTASTTSLGISVITKTLLKLANQNYFPDKPVSKISRDSTGLLTLDLGHNMLCEIIIARHAIGINILGLRDYESMLKYFAQIAASLAEYFKQEG